MILYALILSGVAHSQKLSSCIECHLSPDWVSDTTIAGKFLERDVHHNFGLDCSDCHGGDPKVGFVEEDPSLAMDTAKGFSPHTNRLKVPDFCGGCHSNIEYMKDYNPRLSTEQLRLYKTSVHGKRLYNDKDTMVAVCSDCHGTHGILPPDDSRSSVYHNNVPYTCKACHSNEAHMKGYRYKGKPIPTNQFEQYSQSVHGKLVLEQGDKSAPACNNCHGSHGATPPQLASVAAACGECHASNQTFFDNSPHKKPWDELGIPECERCHGNHLIHAVSDTMIGTTPGALCIECHDPGSPGYVVAGEIRADIDSLKFAVAHTDSLLNSAGQKGLAVSEEQFQLNSSKDALIQLRATVHTFDPAAAGEIADPAIKNADEIGVKVQASFQDIRNRQIALGVSLILIIIVVIALRRKIIALDKKANIE